MRDDVHKRQLLRPDTRSFDSLLRMKWCGAMKTKLRSNSEENWKSIVPIFERGIGSGFILAKQRVVKGLFRILVRHWTLITALRGEVPAITLRFLFNERTTFRQLLLHSVRINVVECFLSFSANCLAMTFRSSSPVSLFRMDSLALILCRTAILNCNILLSDWFRK